MKKRILSMALVLALCVGCMPTVSAFHYIPGPTTTWPGGFVVKDDNTLVAYEGEAGDIVIPDGITAIGSEAFARNQEITSVTIPEGVTSIGMRAFWSCKNLTQVSIPDSVSVIESFAFQFSGLTSVDIPGTVQTMDDYVFANCSNLSTVTLGRGITEIGDYMFQQSGVTEVVIPDTVTSIGTQAFHECYELTAVTIPPSVESISLQTFSKKGVVFNKDLTIYCEPGTAAAVHAEQWANPVYGTFDEDGTFTPDPEEPTESETPIESEPPAESKSPVESEPPAESQPPEESAAPVQSEAPSPTPKPTPTPTPKPTPTPSGGSGGGSGSGGGGGGSGVSEPVKSKDPLRVELERAERWQASLLSQQENTPDYLRNLANNREVLELYTTPRYYVHTIVTDQVQKLSDEVCMGRGSELDKAMAIYDWIASNIYYDGPNMYELHEPPAQQVLDEGKWVCSGFATLFQAMCWAQKIPCVYMGGTADGVNHAWNAIKIGGKWYWSDPTFGCKNILESNGDVVENQAGLLYFLCSNEFFTIDHIAGGASSRHGMNAVTYDDLTVEEQEETVAEETKSSSLSSWAKDEVCAALRSNLVPDGLHWNYSLKISRQNFCTLMVQLVTRYNYEDIDSYLAEQGLERIDPFTDTDNSDVLAAYALGIVKGKSDTTFDPRGEITRQEAATMLARTGRLLGVQAGQGSDFADADTFPNWAAEGIGYVSGVADPYNGKKVMEGTGNGYFSPLEPYTQEQAIITALRLFSASGKQTVRKSAGGE